MKQVFEQSNRDIEGGESSKNNTSKGFTSWSFLDEIDNQEPADYEVNILYLLSSMGFVSFKDFEEHFSGSFVEIKTQSEVKAFKNNFFVLLAAI